MAIQDAHAKTSAETALQAAKEAALGFLAHRNRSESEVRRRLNRQFSGSIVEQAVHWLKTKGLVDDAVLAQEWRRQRERKRPRGEAIIRQELRGLGIDQQVVDGALEGFDGRENAYQAARAWWSKLNSSKHVSQRTTDASTEYAKLRRRLWGYLQRRGFEHELIGETVRRLWSELSDPLDGGVDADAHEQQGEDVESVG